MISIKNNNFQKKNIKQNKKKSYKSKKLKKNNTQKITKKKKYIKNKNKIYPSQINNISLKPSYKVITQSQPLILPHELLNYIRLKNKYKNFLIFLPKTKQDTLKTKFIKYILNYTEFAKFEKNIKFNIWFDKHTKKLSKINEINNLYDDELPNLILNLKKKYKTNKKIRFFIIPIKILFNNYLSKVFYNNLEGHGNLIIIDLHKNTAEYFEPHGGRYSIPNILFKNKNNNIHRDIFNNIKNYFNHIFKKTKTKFILPYEYLPEYTFQSLEDHSKLRNTDLQKGYCIIWTHWYLSLRLKFPNINSKKLIKKVESLINHKTSFLDLIRNYNHFLIKESYKLHDKLEIKYKKKLTEKDFINIVKKVFTF